MENDTTIRWLHLSDFHVGKDDYEQRRLFGKIHEHVHDRVVEEGPPDFVFITGDLAQSGRPGEYSMFYNQFLMPLQLDVLGDGWNGKIFTIPGNHDVDLSVNSYFDRDAISQPGSHFFDVSSEGNRQREIVLPRFRAYLESEDSNSPANWLSSEAGSFCERLEVRGHVLGLVGVNTSWLCKDKADRHRLTPGVSLLENALDRLKDCDARVVLGHHPLDWLLDGHAEPLRALLGQHHAIYLHGHLHKSVGQREEGGGRSFLTVQSGACFQARDDEKWINGLLWGELDLKRRELRLQPRHWNPLNRDWPTTSDAFPQSVHLKGTDWWSFPLPGSESENVKLGKEITNASRPPTPEGWQIVDQEFLDSRRKQIEEHVMLRFFDGSVPSWGFALSPLIPRRAVVTRLADLLRETPEGRPRVVLLVGPGAEGKSTVFLQTIAALLETTPSLRVLWRHNENTSLTVKDILALSEKERLIVATDDADLIAEDLFFVVKAFQATGRSGVSWFLSCRDTDWHAAGGDAFPWTVCAELIREGLSGLDKADALQIVRAWSHYGLKGLGQLAGKGEAEAASDLVEAATREAEVEEGAFFGAMLKVRIGGSLHEHMKTLIDRLLTRTIFRGRTLLDAFAYVAAMHAERLTFLSRPVLAEALGCSLRDLRPKILAPLGQEAAAVGNGSFLVTRHRMIAQVAIEVLSGMLSWDRDEFYVDLARAAIRASEQTYVPELKRWRFELPRHFLNTDRIDLALRLGVTLLDAEPNHIQTRVSVASLYRDAKYPEGAAQLFREYTGSMNRSAWFEWGVAEGANGDQLRAAWLEALSLADQTNGPPPDNKSAKLSLAGLGVAFGELFAAYNNRAFIEGCGAVAKLGLTLPLDPIAQGFFEGHQRLSRAKGVSDMSIEQALDLFDKAVRAVIDPRNHQASVAFARPVPDEVTFGGLRRLIEARRLP